MRQNRLYHFNMNYLELFGILTGVGVDVSKFFRVGAGVLKCGAGAESESEICDSAHLWCTARNLCFNKSFKRNCTISTLIPNLGVWCKKWFIWTLGVGEKNPTPTPSVVKNPTPPKTSDCETLIRSQKNQSPHTSTMRQQNRVRESVTNLHPQQSDLP